MSRAHVRVPNGLLYSDVPDGGVRLWALLDDLCREWASVHLAVPGAARALRTSSDSVKRWRRALTDADWLLYEPARGRGEVSLWTPMKRARPVVHHRPVPVDNSAGRGARRGADLHPSDLGKGCSGAPLDMGGTRAHTEEQKRAGRVIVLPLTEQRPAPPCVLCAGSRWVDSLAFPDRVERCPACQPGAQGPF